MTAPPRMRIFLIQGDQFAELEGLPEAMPSAAGSPTTP